MYCPWNWNLLDILNRFSHVSWKTLGLFHNFLYPFRMVQVAFATHHTKSRDLNLGRKIVGVANPKQTMKIIVQSVIYYFNGINSDVAFKSLP